MRRLGAYTTGDSTSLLESRMIPNFATVETGVYRGGQPTDAADWDMLERLGVNQVIKLNYDSEGSDEEWARRGHELFKLPESLAQQIITEPSVPDILTAVAFVKPGTFIHCKHGEDRTGLVVAAWRLSQGWTKAAAYEEMKAHGFHGILFGLDKAWADLTENTKP